MRARTKEEKKVSLLSKKLKPISESAKSYAYKHCFPDIGLYWKRGDIWCQCCGRRSHVVASELGLAIDHGYVCQGCGKRLKLKYYKVERTSMSVYFSMFQTCEGYQVIRTFEVSRDNARLEGTRYGCVETWQNWIGENGRETLLGLDYSRSPFSFTWFYDGGMSVKRHNGGCSGYFVMEDVFDITGNVFYRRGGVTKLLRRNGWSMDILDKKGVDIIPLLKSLASMDDAFVEELVKHKQYGVLSYWLRGGGSLEDRARLRNAVRICERNKYIVEDGSLYADYVELLFFFNLDTRNAKYACPDDLRGEHDRLLRKKRKREARRKLEEKMKMARAHDERYRERVRAFLGLSFVSGDIRVEPLKSVGEFMAEGVAMHHCVYDMGYYDGARHPDSLILSARGKGGERLETIEVNTKSWKIMQSRGVCNQNSPRHDDIVRLVADSMPSLRRAAYTAKKEKITQKK